MLAMQDKKCIKCHLHHRMLINAVHTLRFDGLFVFVFFQKKMSPMF